MLLVSYTTVVFVTVIGMTVVVAITDSCIVNTLASGALKLIREAVMTCVQNNGRGHFATSYMSLDRGLVP